MEHTCCLTNQILEKKVHQNPREESTLPLNCYRPGEMSAIKRQTVKFLSYLIITHTERQLSLFFFRAQSERIQWQFAATAAGFSWQRSWLMFSEVRIHCIYPFYCQLGSHIHKAMIGYPYPLREDTEMTDNKGRRCLNGEWERVYGNKERKKGKDGDSEMTARELKLSRRICLTFPWSCPRALGFPVLSGEDSFSIYFIFISVLCQLFIQRLVLLVSERGAVKSITLTVLT